MGTTITRDPSGEARAGVPRAEERARQDTQVRSADKVSRDPALDSEPNVLGTRTREPNLSAPSAIQYYLDALAPRQGDIRLLTPEDVDRECEALSSRGVEVQEIGRSRAGRPIHSLKVGEGPIQIVAIAGAHPDEPVGTSTCLHFARTLATDPRLRSLREKITVRFVPQCNPDGSASNARWFPKWSTGADLKEYLLYVQRDLPQDDVEFGFPEIATGRARPENQAMARWFDGIGKIDHYVSLHSMFLGGGALFLVTARDMDAVAPKLRFLLEQAGVQGLPLHDKDRAGQKGFHRICAGIQTAPTAEAMREFFSAGNAGKVAEHFLLNSMQYVQRNNDCPLAFVSEIPLACDPRLSSMVELPYSRADEELRLADGLSKNLDEIAELLVELEGLALAPEKIERVKDLARRITSGRAAVDALRGDLARYGDTRATEGNALETAINVHRRKATYLALVHSILDGEASTEADRLRTEVDRKFDDVVADIGEVAQFRFPSLDVQARLQMASLLGALIGERSTEPDGAV